MAQVIDVRQLIRAVFPQLAQQNDLVRKERHRYDWRSLARPEQIAPGEPGAAIASKNWRYWMIQTGRGWGKSRSASETVRARVREGRWRSIALVAPTLGDGRKLMIEGPTGIIECSPPEERPRFIASDRELIWPNGAKGFLYTSEEPDRLRGGNHDGAWADELGSWRNDLMSWRMLRLATRITGPRGDRPQIVLTTTPRPTPLLRWLNAAKGLILQTGSTYDNKENLDEDFFEAIKEEFEGTRLGEQEIEGKLLGDTPGALWRMTTIDNTRVRHVPSDLVRVVVAVDPAVADPEERRLARLDSEHSIAETGIVVAGRARCLCNGRDEQHAFVLADVSGYYAPEKWATTAIGAYDEWNADRLVGEENNGGALVAANVRAQAGGRRISYVGVHASRGKQTRAEPIATLYERGVVHHVGVHGKLEDQMTTWSQLLARKSPDRMDALVWALTELMLTPGTNIHGRTAHPALSVPGRRG